MKPEGKKKKQAKSLPIITQCVLCSELPRDLLDKIEHAWLTLNKTSRQIGRHYKLPEDLVDVHIRRCLVNKHHSRFQRVSTSFDRLWEAIDVAHEHYLRAPSTFTANSYQGFVGQLRGLLQDLEKVQNAPELAGEIIRIAVNPLIRRLTDAIILESSAVREDIATKFGEQDAAKLVNDFVRRVGIVFGEATKDLQTEIENVLSARDRNRGRQQKPKPEDRAKVLKLVK